MKKLVLTFIIIFILSCDTLSQEFQSGSRWISASSGLRMRDQPNLSGKKLDVIPYGERVNFITEKGETVYLAGTNGKWTNVKWGETVGWVYGGFLSDLHPDKATLDKNALSAFYFDKWEDDLSFCRVELNGHGFTLKKDGTINLGDYEYGITKLFLFEKGISVSINEGYEWGSTDYEFDPMYNIEEVFALAIAIYGEKYRQYLKTENDQPVLPTSAENSFLEDPEGHTIGNFQSEIIDGAFESFRIEEEEGCIVWWYFLIEDGFIRFGDGGGC